MKTERTEKELYAVKNVFGDPIIGTAFDLFESDYKVKLLTIKLQCPKCGHIWGVKIEDYDSMSDIPDRKFKCTECDI